MKIYRRKRRKSVWCGWRRRKRRQRTWKENDKEKKREKKRKEREIKVRGQLGHGGQELGGGQKPQ